MEYLKIKDNIDLKELEKFGFKHYGFYKSEYWHNNSEIAVLSDMSDRRLIISADSYCVDDNVINKLYDLIQAGLVEKVVKE